MTDSDDCWDNITHRQIAEYSSRMLWRFVQPNASESEAEEVVLNLTGLTEKDLELLASIRFLLSDSVDQLINTAAPKIISRLSKESVNEYITGRNRVCGRIEWHHTAAARVAAGNDPSIFVYSRHAQLFDLPENRLFLFILQQINDKARKFVSDDYINGIWYEDKPEGKKWIEKIAVIAYKSNRLLKNPYILKISRIYEISDKIIEAAYRNRQAYYKMLADAGRKYVLCEERPLAFLKEELNNNILEPLSKDTLFETAVLFNTLETLMAEGWIEKHSGLIGGSSKIVSLLEKEQRQVKVYTQKLPDEVKAASIYGNIMSDYGLSEKLRRPDIILEFTNDQRKYFLIIEVKRSKNRSYLADGTYKLLGYLMDFKGIKNEKTNLSGFLVGWNGILNREFDFKSDIHLFNWFNFKEGFRSFLHKYENS